MTEQIIPEDLFSSFEVFGLVRPMAGTFHVVDLQLENSSSILEHTSEKGISHFHDPVWLRDMGMTMLYSMSQSPRPIFGFSTATSISILYKILPTKHTGTELISGALSNVSSFLGTRINTAVRFSGTLLEFPNPKILTAFFLWKQNLNRNLMIESLSLEALISNGGSVKDAKETLDALGDREAKLSLIADYFETDKVPNWHTNGVASYWVPKEEGIKLTLHQDLPSGPDFLAFMIDIFDQE